MVIQLLFIQHGYDCLLDTVVLKLKQNLLLEHYRPGWGEIRRFLH